MKMNKLPSAPLMLLLSSVFLICGVRPCPAQGQDPVQTISLKDGTVLKGRLVSVDNGEYVIETENLGDVRVDASRIQAITAGNPSFQAGQNAFSRPITGGGQFGMGAQGGMGGQMIEMQKLLLSDPELMADIQAIAQDPAMMELMADPAFVNSLLSGRMQANDLQNNTGAQQLLNNPKMQDLMKKIADKMQSSSRQFAP